MSGLADPRASRAVLIGTARYHHLHNLPAVEHNLTELRKILTDPELWGLPDENCQVVLDATDPRRVARLIRTCAAAVEPHGQLLVYFAGHGLVDPIDNSLLLALRDTEPEAPHESSVPFEHVRRAVAASPASRRVVILDCCYAGRAEAAMSAEVAGSQAVADMTLIDHTCLIVSAPRTRRAQAPEGATYTAFTGELVRVLRDGISDAAAVLDARTVWHHVLLALRSKGFERPEIRTGNAGESLGLVRNAARSHHALAGSILLAAPHLTDDELRQAAVLVLRYDPTRGAVGVRLNRPLGPLPETVAPRWSHLVSEPALLFDGGPVSNRKGYGYIAVALLRPEARAPVRFRPVRDRLGTISLQTNPPPEPSQVRGVRLFSGYLGWKPGQLEADLDEGTLVRTQHPSHVVLSGQPENLWAGLQRA